MDDKETHIRPQVGSRDDSGGPWSEEELAASVEAYLRMLRLLREGVVFRKKDVYEDLARRFPPRSSGSFEYRMQNISYVMHLIGRRWLPGLKPARNAGVNIAERIERIILKAEDSESPPRVRFEMEARERADTTRPLPAGNATPRTTTSKATIFVRDPAVRSWVAAQASGVCECCGQPAPFATVDGPYLEVHHVRHLADFGPDTVDNAVAICPNCHRRLHFSLDAPELIESLYKRVARLRRL